MRVRTVRGQLVGNLPWWLRLRCEDATGFPVILHNGPDAAHRRTILLVDGELWLAQRYAIDWVQYRMSNGVATTWAGAENENPSYFCYDAPVLSVAAGKVVGLLDGVLSSPSGHSGCLPFLEAKAQSVSFA